MTQPLSHYHKFVTFHFKRTMMGNGYVLFHHSLFKDACNIETRLRQGMMNDELWRIWKEAVVV
jgi:hypothetical protein